MFHRNADKAQTLIHHPTLNTEELHLKTKSCKASLTMHENKVDEPAEVVL